MAFTNSLNFRGAQLEGAYIRMGYAPQVFKKERRVHLIFDLYASKEAFSSGNEPLQARYLTVDMWADNKKDLSNRPSLQGLDRGKHLNVYRADVARLWGEEVSGGLESFPNNVFAQGYVLAKTLDDLKDMKEA